MTNDKRLPNPDGGRGSFFPAPAYQKKHRPQTELQTALDHIRHLKFIVGPSGAIDEEENPAIVPRETCETFADHEFEESMRYAQTMTCAKCGMLAEHPAHWYAIQGIADGSE